MFMRNGVARKVGLGLISGCVMAAASLFAPISAQAQEVVLFFDDFQNDPTSRWRSGGFLNSWEFVFEGTNRILSESPGREYEGTTNSYASTYNPLNLSNQTNCRILWDLRLDTELDKDFLFTEASTDGQAFVPVSQLTGSTGGVFQTFDRTLGSYSGQPNVWFRFRLASDNNDANNQGADIDNVRIVCGAPAPTPTPSPSESGSSSPTAIPSSSPSPSPTSGACTSTSPCETNTTGSVRSVRGGKLKVAGGVTPAVPGGKVVVVLFRKKDGKFRKVASKTDELNTASLYSVTLNRPSSGTCKVTAAFLGDEAHLASAAGTKFNC